MLQIEKYSAMNNRAMAQSPFEHTDNTYCVRLRYTSGQIQGLMG